MLFLFFFQAEDGIRDTSVTGVQTCALPISTGGPGAPIRGPAQAVSGFRLVDARASYGVGLETFAIGFPIHFDWAWRTLLDRKSTRLNSSHRCISYAVFCLKKKKNKPQHN